MEEGSSNQSEQMQAPRRKSVVSQAQALYLERGGKNIEFRFGFNKEHPIRNAPKVAQSIAALVPSFENRANGQIPRTAYAHIPELGFMYLYGRTLKYSDEPIAGFPDGEPDGSQNLRAWMNYHNAREARALREGCYEPLAFDAKWDLTQVHSPWLMSVNRLQEIVAEKDEKAREYAPCDAYWLLVVVDFIDPAQEQEIRVDCVTIKSERFERVVVYKPRFEHIIEIVPQSSIAPAPEG